MVSEDKGYVALQQEDAKTIPSPDIAPRSRRREQGTRQSRLSPMVIGALILSLAFNIFSATKQFKLPTHSYTDAKTPYAGLERELLLPWSWKSQREDNETKTARLWDKISLDDGVIALEDSYTETLHLPRGQRFPWDRTRSVYVVNGYHNLHCLTIMRLAFMTYAQGETPEDGTYHHVQHCLESLRQDVICDADDTPRFAGFEKGVSGDEQLRQCRDWAQLEAWSKEHTACYRYDHEAKYANKLWHYSFCPPESPYFEASQKALGDM